MKFNFNDSLLAKKIETRESGGCSFIQKTVACACHFHLPSSCARALNPPPFPSSSLPSPEGFTLHVSSCLDSPPFPLPPSHSLQILFSSPAPPAAIFYRRSSNPTAAPRVPPLPPHIHNLGLQHRCWQNPSIHRPRRLRRPLSFPHQIHLSQAGPNRLPLRFRLPICLPQGVRTISPPQAAEISARV